ncbi:unnamed protein product [Gongylonema pulchrum]|uniref:RRM domain-containing protein n=1 Tax=Gongylonema pulchrum TaxID=637853 RepID=A0A183D850_9BILA|nr:unnamed protein product [Gongylonema pulchrum]
MFGQVQVRPWRLSDAEYMVCDRVPVSTKRTIFIGGVPRPTKASDLARILNEMCGQVSYVGLAIDPELEYPKGAARVTFATEQAFVAALRAGFIYIPHAGIQKRVIF